MDESASPRHDGMDPLESNRSVDIDTRGLAPARPLDVDDVDQHETFIEGTKDVELFLQTWEPADGSPVSGVVALLHGYGEHSSRFDHVAGALARSGYAVAAIDARGHGRSTGKRAYVDDYDDYVLDFDRLVDWASDRWSGLPVFAVGHSNGGLVVLRHALERATPVQGYVVSSPMVGFADDISLPRAMAGRLLSGVWPTFSIGNGVDPATLSHDERVVTHYQEDPLVLDVATAGWFTESLAAQQDLRSRADELDDPFLFLLAGDDKLVDPDAAEAVFHEIGSSDRQLEVFPHLFHEILNEPEWVEIVDRMVDWLDRRRNDAEGEAA